MRNRLALSDTWLLELYLSLYTIVWGLGYANPLTDAFQSSPSYAVLRLFPGGELTFGVAVTILGALKLAASVYGQRDDRTLLYAIGALFWLGIVFAIGIPSQWSAGGLPHFGLAAIANWYLWVRLRYRGPT